VKAEQAGGAWLCQLACLTSIRRLQVRLVTEGVSRVLRVFASVGSFPALLLPFSSIGSFGMFGLFSQRRAHLAEGRAPTRHSTRRSVSARSVPLPARSRGLILRWAAKSSEQKGGAVLG
jgi:hypothetical protein